MEKLTRRIAKNNRGETIVETLAGIVVCTLAVLILVTATVTAARINKQAEDRDAQLNVEQLQAEKNVNPLATEGTVTFGGSSLTVTYYGGESMTSYVMK
jgi:hypothetical protein